ncbi:hypothetical protein VCHA38O209_50274 [Vibrio chagasii]|nr:hypothetical protein VCHA38O209_50274 [Vibrio chagasii]
MRTEEEYNALLEENRLLTADIKEAEADAKDCLRQLFDLCNEQNSIAYHLKHIRRLCGPLYIRLAIVRTFRRIVSALGLTTP